MRAAGFLRRMAVVAAIPSRPGIEMSLTMTSGDSRSAAATSATPSCTCAMTSNSVSSRSRQEVCGVRVIVGEQQAWVMHGVGNALSLGMRRCAADMGTYGGAGGETTETALKITEGKLRRVKLRRVKLLSRSGRCHASGARSSISRWVIAYFTSSAVDDTPSVCII